DAIFDRGALIALPETTRKQYTQHLCSITHQAAQLLITLVYDQSLLPGPPFSISEQEIRSHYDHSYATRLLEATEQEGGLKGIHNVLINVWLLTPQNPENSG
ncbi:MAG: thiopurine S-methyltransferase, partial [Nevskiales bacterium]